MSVDRNKWPVMVRLGLGGLPSRGAAWACFWLALVIAAGCVAYGFVQPWAFVSSLMVFAALWYYLSIRWVDAHSTWG
jgi:hypothetical protein